MKYKALIILIIIFITHLLLRSDHLFEWANFGWDQVDSAWAAKSIIADHNILINGPVAKGNSGIYMGPLYFWLISIFYFFTNLDPIASPIFQLFLSIVNLFVLYFVTKKIFNNNIAIIACLINTFSITVMNADRVQSAYYLIVPISYLIFYALYKIISGSEKHIIWLAVFVGLSFHIDFTSVMFPMIVLFALPFFPKSKKTIKYILLAIPLFLLFLLPSILISFQTFNSTSHNYSYLFNTYYHGLHLRRIWQLFHDGFISFEQIFQFEIIRKTAFLALPIFMAIYYKVNKSKSSFLLFYLIVLWIGIPWIVMSTYSGELTDYYFSFPRDIVIAILAYLLTYLYQQKHILIKIIPILLLAIYIITGIQSFLLPRYGNLLQSEANVKQAIKDQRKIPYIDHNPESYIYEVYTRKK